MTIWPTKVSSDLGKFLKSDRKPMRDYRNISTLLHIICASVVCESPLNIVSVIFSPSQHILLHLGNKVQNNIKGTLKLAHSS